MKIVKFFIIFLICVIIGAFAAHNANYVPLNFYPFDIKISVAAFFLVFISAFIGILLSSIVVLAKFVQHRRAIKAKNRQIESLEKELAAVRSAQQVTYAKN